MKRIASLVLVLSLALCLTACKKPAKNEEETPTTTTVNSEYTNLQYNPLTGLVELDGSSNRPVGIMVANDSSTRGSQAGIDKADLYVEIETEGSIPRIMAVFGNAGRLPDKIGPVRSARYSFVTMANALDVIYCHAGGHSTVRKLLSTGFVDHIDALSNMGSGTMTPEAAAQNKYAFWRDAELKEKMDYVHSVATGKDKLSARIEKAEFATSPKKNLPFTFGKKAGDITANNVQMKVTPSNTTSFVYNSETGLYTKQYGGLENGTPHTSLEGNAITASNIVVLYAEKYFGSPYSQKTTANFREGDGTGYIVSGGTAREIKYNRTDSSLTLTETDGSPALFATGKTYLCLVDKTLADKTSFS